MSKPSTFLVTAKPGQPCPMEGFARKVDRAATTRRLADIGVARKDARACDLVFRDMIYEIATEVPNTRYYRRRLIKGDLLQVTEQVAKVRPRAAKKEE